MLKKIAVLTVSLAAGVMMLSSLVRAESWDMPTPYPDKTFHTANIIQFAQDVEKATNGALKIKVHSAGSLIKHPDISKAVRRGQVPIGEFFLSLLSNENGAYGADSLPFLATNYEDAEKLWTAQKEIISGLLAKQGIMPLFAVPWPPQGLYSKKEIKTVDDLKGLKFRSYNATLEKFVKLAGAAPTQVEVPDIAQAFATNRVEAMITSPSTGANSKAWDYVSNYYDIQAWVPKNIIVVNKAAFEKLPADVQKAVLEQAAVAEKRGWEMSKAETTAQTKVLKDNGMKVYSPSPELVMGLIKIGEKLKDDWKSSTGADADAILTKYNK